MWRRLQRAGRATGGAAHGQVSIDAALPAVVCAAYSYGPCGDRNQVCGLALRPVCCFEVGRVRRRNARSVHGERCLRSAKRARRERAGADGQRQDGDASHCRSLLPAATLGDQRALRTLFFVSCKEVRHSVAGSANTRPPARNVSRSLRRRMWTCLNEKPGRKSPGPAARGDSSRTRAMPYTSRKRRFTPSQRRHPAA